MWMKSFSFRAIRRNYIVKPGIQFFIELNQRNVMNRICINDSWFEASKAIYSDTEWDNVSNKSFHKPDYKTLILICYPEGGNQRDVWRGFQGVYRAIFLSKIFFYLLNDRPLWFRKYQCYEIQTVLSHCLGYYQIITKIFLTKTSVYLFLQFYLYFYNKY